MNNTKKKEEEEVLSVVKLTGRPFRFQDPVALQERLEEYFNTFPPTQWTVTGLSIFLECDRDTLLNYEKNSHRQHENVPSEVIRLIKRAKMMVHNAYELDLRKKGRSGDIFALKNFGWTDKQEVDHTTKGESINESDEIKSLTKELNEIYRSKSGGGDGRDASSMDTQTRD